MFDVVKQLPGAAGYLTVVVSYKGNNLFGSLVFFSLICLYMIFSPQYAFSGDYESLETRNRLGIEVHYSESNAFENEMLLTESAAADYVRRYKYLDSFPKMKGSLRYTRYLENGVAASVMYKYLSLFNAPDAPEEEADDITQHLVDGEVSKKIADIVTLFMKGEVISDSRDFYTYKPGAGISIDFGSTTSLSAEGHYFFRDDDAKALGGEITAMNYILRLRQVLTTHTALFVEYDTVITDIEAKTTIGTGEEAADVDNNFTSHTIAVQVSRYFDNQTALHGRLRYYDNTDIGVQSLAPSIRVDKYLGWATVISGQYRYYQNNNTNVEVLTNGATGSDTIVDNDITSHTLSCQLKREVNADLNMFARYRYYMNNFDIDMNTVSIGAELLF